jgi:carbamoyltransferase
MRIIGISHDMYISSAALIEDGRIIAAAAEERFTREKQTRAFPANAIRYCLAEAGCDMTGVDYVAASWNPGVYFQNYNPLLSGRRRHFGEHLYAVPDSLMTLYPGAKRPGDWTYQEVPLDGATSRVYFVTHHRAHAANAFLLSPFESAAILTADAQGEVEATTFAVGRGSRIELLKAINYPQSIGAFYSTFTEHLGYKANSDEWKVMALASFADGRNIYYRLLRDEVVRFLPDGGYEFDLTFFNGFNRDLPNLYTPKLVERFGPPRKRDEPLEERHMAIAAAIQQLSEDLAVHMLAWLHAKTGERRLAVSGGFFMNSVLNGKLLRLTEFEEVFISSCPDDSGNALGAAYYVENHILERPRGEPLVHNYLGPSFADAEIADALRKYQLPVTRADDVAAEAAAALAGGKLAGWFQGRMEFGQRALGARSILADPRQAATKDKVNLAVKYRENFRPFAPAVLADAADDWFDLDPKVRVPFMERVYMVRPERRAQIGAVTHVDGSGRLQTVDMETNPLFHRLIASFKGLTGVPIVLNTSFNLNGEPIVCTPTDAIRTFFSCGLDVLFLGNYVLDKGALGRV